MNIRALKTPIARVPDVLPPRSLACPRLAAVAERDRLLHLVQRRPGITVGEAAMALGIGQNNAGRHFRVLVDVGLVRASSAGNLRHHFAERKVA